MGHRLQLLRSYAQYLHLSGATRLSLWHLSMTHGIAPGKSSDHAYTCMGEGVVNQGKDQATEVRIEVGRPFKVWRNPLPKRVRRCRFWLKGWLKGRARLLALLTFSAHRSINLRLGPIRGTRAAFSSITVHGNTYKDGIWCKCMFVAAQTIGLSSNRNQSFPHLSTHRLVLELLFRFQLKAPAQQAAE